VRITAGSREVPGRNACDRRHTYCIIIIIISIYLFICSVFNDTNSSGYIIFYDLITADRWNKMKVFVVGKFKKPRCFKNAMHLPVVFDSQGKLQKVKTVLGQQAYTLVG